MAVKVTVVSPGKNRISINKQDKATVRTVTLSSFPDQLSELKDVDMSDADTNETLVYDETSAKFIVKPLPNLDGGTF